MSDLYPNVEQNSHIIREIMIKHVYNLRGTLVSITRFFKVPEGYHIGTTTGTYLVSSRKMCNFLASAESQNKRTLSVFVVKRFCGEALHFSYTQNVATYYETIST